MYFRGSFHLVKSTRHHQINPNFQHTQNPNFHGRIIQKVFKANLDTSTLIHPPKERPFKHISHTDNVKIRENHHLKGRTANWRRLPFPMGESEPTCPTKHIRRETSKVPDYLLVPLGNFLSITDVPGHGETWGLSGLGPRWTWKNPKVHGLRGTSTVDWVSWFGLAGDYFRHNSPCCMGFLG